MLKIKYIRMMDSGETGGQTRGAEGDAENSQAKGPDTVRNSGKQRCTDEAKSFRYKDRAHGHDLYAHALFLIYEVSSKTRR